MDGSEEWTAEEIRDRLRRRAAFLRDLAEARELRRRVARRYTPPCEGGLSALSRVRCGSIVPAGPSGRAARRQAIPRLAPHRGPASGNIPVGAQDWAAGE